MCRVCVRYFFFQAEDGIRYLTVTGVQTCALPILPTPAETAVLITNWTQFTRAFGDLVGDAAAAESADTSPAVDEIGRASCRERGLRSVGAASAIAKNSSPAPSHAACLPDHHQHHA